MGSEMCIRDSSPPSSSDALDLYFKRHPDIRDKLKDLSPEMRAVAWYSFWYVFNSAIKRSQGPLSFNAPNSLSQEDAVDFMIRELGLKPPKLIDLELG